MRKILMYLFLAAFVASASAADAKWLTDVNAAKAKAQKEGKAILVNFTGSKWCPPCIALKKNVFKKKEFAQFAAKNLVLVELDFPELESKVPKRLRDLEAEYKVEGYPSVIILDKDGKELGRLVPGYLDETLPEYIRKLENVLAKGR